MFHTEGLASPVEPGTIGASDKAGGSAQAPISISADEEEDQVDQLQEEVDVTGGPTPSLIAEVDVEGPCPS